MGCERVVDDGKSFGAVDEKFRETVCGRYSLRVIEVMGITQCSAYT